MAGPFKHLVMLVMLLSATSLFAQRILYDSNRDKTAQDADSAAKEITNGDLFDKMLLNADQQARHDIDTQMDFVRQEMRSKLEAFKYWNNKDDQPDEVRHFSNGKVSFVPGFCKSGVCELKSIRARIEAYLNDPSELKPAQVQQRLDQLEAKKKHLDEELQALEDSAKKNKDPFVIQAFSLLNDHGKDAIDFGQQVLKRVQDNEELAKIAQASSIPIPGALNALDKLGDGLDQTLSLYKAVSAIWEGYDAVKRDPSSLGPSKKQVDLELLVLDQDHIKMIARINARKSLELGAALERVNTALAGLDKAGVLNSYLSVEDSLRDAVHSHNRDQLLRLLDTLHEGAAAIAEEDAAGRLADLRLSSEQRRYSIRKSAVNSSTYNLTIQAATQRLALYWKGGIKPQDIAQWAFYVANTAGVAAVAAK